MKKKYWLLVTIIVLIVGVALVYKYVYADSAQQQRARQAVFLTNGQVYFGYLDNSKNQIVTLRDVYYLKQQQGLQSGEPADKQVSVIKLGNELHGPEDQIKINRDHVLFYESMRSDSRINQAIAKFISGPDGAVPSTQEQSVPAAPTQ